MPPISRSYAAKVDDVDKKNREVTSIVSTEEPDRYATVLLAAGCDSGAYLKNPVVLWAHGQDSARGSLPIGRNVSLRFDRAKTPRIIARTRFLDDEFSSGLFAMYRDGFCSAWSIRALPKKFGPPTSEEIRRHPDWRDVATVYRAYELLETSAVGVPGNGSCTTLDEQDVPALRSMIARGMFVHPDVRRQLDAKRPIDPRTGLSLPPLSLSARTFEQVAADMVDEALIEFRATLTKEIRDLTAFIRDRRGR